MKTGCRQIDQVIELAIQDGNKIFNIPSNPGGDGKLIVWMYDPLSNKVKVDIESNNLNLKFWDFKGEPHNPAASGYTCNECSVVLAFPNTKTPRIKSSDL